MPAPATVRDYVVPAIAAGPGDVAIAGDEDAVAAQILALADAGVTDFVAAELARAEDRERTRSLLKALIAAS